MPRLDLTEIGSTGLKRTGGWIQEEFLTQLQGSRANKIYTEMSSNDPVIAAMLFAIEMLLRQVSWRVQPGGNSRQDVAEAEFLETCLFDMAQTWEDTISEILSMLVYGFAPLECVFKYRRGPNRDGKYDSRFTDGRLAWRKLSIRAQNTIDRWQFDEEGGLEGLWQYLDTGATVFIPIEKLLLFRTSTAKGNPEGIPILRHSYVPWYNKKHLQQIEGVGIERDLAGIPMALVPSEILASGATGDAATMLSNVKDIVRNVRRDEQEGIVFPSDRDESGNLLYEFKLLTTGGQRQMDVDKVIARYNQEIAMTVLADFILLGHEKVGSFALSSDKTELFAVALGAWNDSIASVFNRYAVPRLFDVNGIRLEKLPELVPGDVESVNLKELGDYLTALTGAGMPLFPDMELEKFLRQAASLPEPPEDAEIMPQPKATPKAPEEEEPEEPEVPKEE